MKNYKIIDQQCSHCTSSQLKVFNDKPTQGHCAFCGQWSDIVSQPKHTQGEWKLDGIYIDAPDGSVIAQVLSEDSKENQANGERIVKAVNLLSFMEKQVSVDDGTITNDVIAQLLKQADGK